MAKLTETKIKDLMTTKITACRAGDSVLDAAKLMAQKDFNGLPVVDKHNKIIGMLTHKELLDEQGEYLPTVIRILNDLQVSHSGDVPEVSKKLHMLNRLKVESIMNTDFHFLDPEAPLQKAAEAFMLLREDPLPVVDERKTLLGIVSKHDLLKIFSDKLNPQKMTPVLTIEADDLNIEGDLKNKFVTVSKNRARFWYFAIFFFLITGFVIAVGLILRIKLL